MSFIRHRTGVRYPWVRASLCAALVGCVLSVLPATAQPTDFTTQTLEEGLTPTLLAEGLVGDGVVVSNVTYIGSDISAGGFSGGDGRVGFDSGIALSTGRLEDLSGPNDVGSTGFPLGQGGDADLDVIASGEGVAVSTEDASVLEFDFVPDDSPVRFDYVFGSEEYLEYVDGGFNDVFGFFVNDVNCALVGTGDPVTIDTINNEDNGDLFIDNTEGPVDLELDGLTTVLQCVAPVNSGEVNRMKLAIADTGDSSLDSAVFLRAGSLTTSEETPIGDPGVSRIDGGTGDARDVAIEACRVAVPFGERANRVVVARDDIFADALTGSALLDDQSCILFTPGGNDQLLDPKTRAEIDRLLPADGGERPVDLVGGTAALSVAVEQELTEAGYAVRRLSGPNRYATARAIATAAHPTSDAVILAYAGNWPDAITAGAYAATAGLPVLLTDTEALHADAQAGITSMGVTRTIIAGGAGVVGPAVEAAVPGGERFEGGNRMATAVDIADRLWSEVDPDMDHFVVVNLERDDAWQLALAAAPISAQFSAAQLGVAADRYPTETETFLESRGFTDLPGIVLIGDLAFIGEGVAEAIGTDIGE